MLLGVLMNAAAAALLPAPLAVQALDPSRDASITNRPPVQRINPSKVILIGDSTMQVGSGWGGSFCAYHVTAFLACLDLARGGRSSYSYRAEGSWDVALGEMKAPGYGHIWVLIQFGHNDQPGKPSRSTSLATEFPANLRGYVADVRTAGATPVLVTPLSRRTFKNGQLDNDLQPWADAVRTVASDLHVALIDLNADSAAAVQAMGQAEADTLAEVPEGTAPTTNHPASRSTEVDVEPMATPKLAFDHTHLGEKGANYFSAMVTRELAKSVHDMRHMLLP